MSSKLIVFTERSILLMCVLVSGLLHAQSLSEIQQSYPFIKTYENRVGNDSEALKKFYNKLESLKEKNNTVTITHIGDSHIQADFFSGKVRENLQLEFGNAGRGLIFPYKVARTNEPYNYQSFSNVTWQSKRNIALADSLPIGVSGITIKTDSAGAFIKLKVTNRPQLDYGFNKISIFHDKCSDCFDILVKDSCSTRVGLIKASEGRKNYSSVNLNSSINEVIFETKLPQHFNHPTTKIYGLLLENGKSGVLYNTIGVNGAEIRHYNQSKFFQEQVKELDTDLFIISLGTNEAFGKGFTPGTFELQLDTLITSLRKNKGGASFILTIPGDHLRNKKYINKNIPLARKAIISYCIKNKIAYWDFLEIMGGTGSVIKWHGRGLTSKDFLHLNRRGYEIQGELFFQAIIHGYNEHKKSRSR